MIRVELYLRVVEEAKIISFHSLIRSLKLQQQEVTLEVLFHNFTKFVGLTADQEQYYPVSL